MFALVEALISNQSCFACEVQKHPIFSAIERGSVRDVRYILAHDAQAVHARGRDDFTPLHFAAVKSAPLHLWSSNAYVKIARLLIEAGADIEAVSNTQVTPLQIATINIHPNIVNLLVGAGAGTKGKLEHASIIVESLCFNHARENIYFKQYSFLLTFVQRSCGARIPILNYNLCRPDDDEMVKSC